MRIVDFTNLRKRIEELKISGIGGVFGWQKSVMNKINIIGLRYIEDAVILMTVEIECHTLGYIINKSEHILMGIFLLKNG